MDEASPVDWRPDPSVDRRRAAGPLAFFSDVHGNLPGLRAVLADIDARPGVEALCLGDLVGYGPHPNEVVGLLHERRIPTLMGNYDRGIGLETGECGCVYVTDGQKAEGGPGGGGGARGRPAARRGARGRRGAPRRWPGPPAPSPRRRGAACAASVDTCSSTRRSARS